MLVYQATKQEDGWTTSVNVEDGKWSVDFDSRDGVVSCTAPLTEEQARNFIGELVYGK